MYVKSPTDIGSQGIVIRKHDSIDSYWVRIGHSEVRRNRTHLFLLDGSNDIDNYLPVLQGIARTAVIATALTLR